MKLSKELIDSFCDPWDGTITRPDLHAAGIEVGMSDGRTGQRTKNVPTRFGTSEHWRKRAQEARELAETIVDPEAKGAMLNVAANYERVAQRADAKEAGVKMPADPRKG